MLTGPIQNALVRGGLGSPSDWLLKALGVSEPSFSGVAVTPRNAMTFAAVFSSVNIIATDVAKLPIEMFMQLEPAGRKRLREHPLDPILHDVFFEDDSMGTTITAFHGKQYLQASALLWGDGYAQIMADRMSGRITGLFPLPPSHVTPYREWSTNRLRYQVMTTAGTATLDPADVFHLKYVAGADSTDIGLSPVRMQREAIGLGLAQQEYLARFYSNDSSPGGILSHPGRLRPQARKALKKSWEDAHAPLSKKHRVALLEEGVTWQQIGMSQQDAQYLENRKFQIEEVARIYRLPLHKLHLSAPGNKATVEQDNIEYVNDCLGGWLENWRSTIVANLVLKAERARVFPVFRTDPLLRGDFASRMNGYAVMMDRGTFSPDDVREKEDMNPIPNGKGRFYFHPLNMVAYDPDVATPDDKPAPPPAAPAKGPGDLPADPGAQQPAGPEGKKNTKSNKSNARSLAVRQRYVAGYRAIFEIAAAKLVESQIATLQRQDEGEDDAGDFEGGLGNSADEVQADAYHNLSGPIFTLAEPIRTEAAEEVDQASGTLSDSSLQVGILSDASLQTFCRDVAQFFAKRHADGVVSAVRQALSDAKAQGVPRSDALEGLYRSWREQSPARIAMAEVVRTANAVALRVYKEAGVRAKRWERGSACAWCDQLGDREVGLDDVFLAAGAVLESEGQQLKYASKIGYGPLHDGCSCSVSAVL